MAPVAGQSMVQQINILRGLAIVGVVAVHTAAHFPQAGGLSPVVAANVVVDVFAHYAVPLFVMLSGLTLAHRYRTGGPLHATTFYARRLSKIVPPYLVFSLLYLLLFTFEYGAPAPSWMAFALATGSAYYHLWFVALLIQLYLLFPVLRALLLRAGSGRGGGPPAGAVLLAALLVQLAWNLGAPLLGARLPQRPLIETLLSERVFASHIFYFVLGMVAGLNFGAFDRRMRVVARPAPGPGSRRARRAHLVGLGLSHRALRRVSGGAARRILRKPRRRAAAVPRHHRLALAVGAPLAGGERGAGARPGLARHPFAANLPRACLLPVAPRPRLRPPA